MTVTAVRLDAELVRRGLARSRTRAAALVHDGRVTVDGAVARKSAQSVPDAAEIVVVDQDDDVSRGARKLSGALAAVAALAPPGLPVGGARCLDAGASTGGFTQVLLRGGAAHVLAVDVGHGQLDPLVASDPRVTAVEGVNVRDLDLAALRASVAGAPSHLGDPVDLVVADLSFISLRTVVPALVRATRPGGRLLVLVKPQFEVGRERLGRGGVVVSPELRAEAVTVVADALEDAGVRVLAVVPSGLAGESGNREYFLWGERAASPLPTVTPGQSENRAALVRRAVVGAEPVVLEALDGLAADRGGGGT
ncbi:TlyA family RNA methyltransferase [Actinotalea sp. Marseille-Q4924]|uniref:TlyA family RNA methyltransferase n=1 Tax=Actinotalea sp. Marseille-Q4924 TaxID=2866571 RepID=UPI002714F42A|nr:TlyA family RNA methyltransferase [Actinotalea sp. Marseille-Q4924]